MKNKDELIIAKKKFNSRLIVGTGKYKNMQDCAKAIKISGADIVTVAVRRVNILNKDQPLLMEYLDPKSSTHSRCQMQIQQVQAALTIQNSRNVTLTWFGL